MANSGCCRGHGVEDSYSLDATIDAFVKALSFLLLAFLSLHQYDTANNLFKIDKIYYKISILSKYNLFTLSDISSALSRLDMFGLGH